ncbi:carbon-nitrogen hydrolase family protein [Candidatus Bathyarchaeota archaeon]|nr:MAG: carbon-nitrogen hydrolase family protein [Candidatus Bathyarchaeota archaeon]TMI55447.1 MAG: carbon-nitrogen hydrolase family protein [Candidatus Bathyarchaeota archaeon]
MKPVSLLLAQTGPKLGNKERNLRQISEQASKARKRNVDLLIFPELHLTGYTMRDEVTHLAEPIPGPSTRKVETLAREHGVHVVFGMPEESEVKGVIHNTAVFVGPKGLVGRYRKIHLPTHSVFEERRYYRPGQEASVFKTDIGTIGLNICYDLYFPELTRLQALQGAELVVCISASPGLRRRFFEGFCLSRAMENAVYLAYVNRVGIEEGLQFWGGSRVIAPNGSVLAQCKYDLEEFQICKVDLGEVSRARAFIPTIKDLEPGLFDQLRTKSREA